MRKAAVFFFAAALLTGTMSLPVGVGAQSASVQAMLETIKQLTQQIEALQAQLNAAKGARAETAASLLTTLREGSRGDAVKTLQAILAADPEIYPEGLITGVYGKLTAKAVVRFQKKQGLPQVGIVGPKTLQKLNKELEKAPVALEVTSASGEKQPCAKVPPGHLIAPGWLRKQGGIAPIVPPCQTLPPGIAKQIGGSGTSTPPTATSSLEISNLIAIAGADSAIVKWDTSKPATGQVFYGTSAAYGSSTALNANLLTSHFHTVTGLLPQTTYHFMVESRDAAGIAATSSDNVFTTSPLADTTPPVISSIAVGSITSSTATVSWVTNELTSGRVLYRYGTSTLPLSASSTQTSLAAAHSANLMGLAASTTYSFWIEAKDAVNNIATSSLQSFATAQ